MKHRLFIIIGSIVFLIGIIGCFLKPSKRYSFFLAGHTYGKAGVNNEGLHPPFVMHYKAINDNSSIELGFLLGDIVSPHPKAQDWIEVDQELESLSIPVHYVVGNHDMENRAVYESRYGKTYYSFVHKSDLFLVLDPNIDEWNITGEQLHFLKETLEAHRETADNIYVFFHQVLWFDQTHGYNNIHTNSMSGRAAKINFWTELIPMFDALNKNVFMFAGDLGAGTWASDVYYNQYHNITFLATGMGDGSGDNYIVVNVLEDKTVDFEMICLDSTDNACLELKKNWKTKDAN